MEPMASLSIDLDDLWAYLMIHGDEGWKDHPSYLALVVPEVLETFTRTGVPATWFLVGRDAAVPRNRDLLRAVAREGHELANHSFSHNPWLHEYSKNEVLREVASAHEAIERIAGVAPVGFRGPGYSWSPDLIEALVGLGYRYDASSLPTFLGPLARSYYFAHSTLTEEQRLLRERLFGTFWDGFRPNKPYRWQTGGGDLTEIPVTTMPFFRFPFHMSYLLFLAGISRKLMRTYLGFALGLCRLTGTSPSFLLHPLDFLDSAVVPELTFFPAMGVDRALKREIVLEVLETLRTQFRVVTLREHEASLGKGGIPVERVRTALGEKAS